SDLQVFTNVDGSFEFEALNTDTLMVSFVGYTTQEVPINDRSSIIVLLLVSQETLDEVVVTALGITRKEKSLGYSVSKMDVKSATVVRDVNVVSSMQGKLAGVEIKKTSGGPGASSRIVIRGNSSIDSNNQPLIVLDGIPIDNTTSRTGGTWGGIDYGSPISDINPDDIESLVVLKGPSAAALYGSRALNGVIVITTKSGKNGSKDWSFSINRTYSVESANFLKDFQNKYGAGTGGEFKYNADSIPFFETSRPSTPTFASSWGPEMLGQEYIDWNEKLSTFSPQEDNYEKFFQTGYTNTNNIAASRGGSYPIRISFTDLSNTGISPTSKFDRQNINISNGGLITKKLTYSLKFSYINQEAYNRVNQSNGDNAARNIIMMPRNVSAESLMDFEDDEGNEQVWYTGFGWIGNPFYTLNRNLNYDDRQRKLGTISLFHQTKSWLNLMGRIGLDSFDENRHSRFTTQSFIVPGGQFNEAKADFLEVNADFLATAEYTFSDKLSMTTHVGGNRMDRNQKTRDIEGSNLINNGVYTLENTPQENRKNRLTRSRSRINSLYSSVLFEYNRSWFLEVTGRNDWSSTLPENNNSYFYPSVSLAHILTERILPKSDLLTFAKVRASIAQVGKDADPHLLNLAYDSLEIIGGVQFQSVHNPFPLIDLQPEKKTSHELGLDVRFFKNRLGVDFTYYDESTVNQIIPRSSISPTSGYTLAVVNGGEIRNNGIELLVTSTLIKSNKFKWNTIINFSKNKSLVVTLNSDDRVESLGSQWRIDTRATAGLPYGSIFGFGIQKDDNGNNIMKANGKFLRTEGKVLLGDINPDWKMGILNGFDYKNFSLNFFIDIQKGGEIYSATNMYLHGYAGNVNATLVGREEWYASEAAREDQNISANQEVGDDYIINWQPTGGYEVDGVYADGTIINGEDVGGQASTRLIDPEDYWSQFAAWGSEIHEPFIYDASYVKLREVSITYVYPKKNMHKGFSNLSFTLSGRNLWLIKSNVPNIDPESTYSNGNGQGVEYAAYPTARSIGLNIQLSF
ncbi:MAG: TonB-linked SusC/RagA family outer membrane protein, partial [Patiriisocius sp.]